MSVPSNPFEDVERLFEQMSRQFEEASRAWQSGEPMTALTGRPMAVDIAERDDEFHVTVDLPGFEHDDVDVRVVDRTLQIDAERERAEEERAEQYIRQERRHEAHHREIPLPSEIDADAISASMDNGVLSITIPKAEEAEGREIEIS